MTTSQKIRGIKADEREAIDELVRKHGISCIGGSMMQDENGKTFFVGLNLGRRATYNEQLIAQEIQSLLKVDKLVINT